MKLSDVKYGTHFIFLMGGVKTGFMKSNRVEGGMRVCITPKGEVRDFDEEAEIKPINEKEQETDEDND